MRVLIENIIQFKQFEVLDSVQNPNIFVRVLLWLKIGVLSVLDLFLVLPAVGYFIHHMSNLMKATEGMYTVASFGTSCVMYVLFIAKRKMVLEVLCDLQKIVDKRIKLDRLMLYQTTENHSAAETRRFRNAVWTACSIVALMPIIKSFAYFIVGAYSADVWFLPFKAILPYDLNNSHWYFFTIAMQTIGVWKYCAAFCSINTFFIGFCRYTETFVDDVRITLNEVDELYVKRTFANAGKTILAMKLKFAIAMEFHIEFLNLLARFADVMSGTIFLSFSVGIVWLCTSLFQFEYQGLSAQLFQSFVANSLCVVWLYIYCFFGDKITSNCSEINRIAYNLKFYSYPVELQRYVTIIMAMSQKPFFITGLQIVRCSLDTYKKMMNTAVSYYMVFKNSSSGKESSSSTLF